MKLNDFIERLHETVRKYGNMEVIVGETNGVIRTGFQINVQTLFNQKVLCIQASSLLPVTQKK